MAAVSIAPARAADIDPLAQVVRAELVAETDAIAPGSAAVLGLRLRHAPHWHTYWVQPGDAGLPTRLTWTLESGYSAGPILWPAPELLRVGSLANYGYEGEVLLPVTVQVPSQARIGASARFAAHADWLVCSDLCIPGGADLTLSLPVRAPADVHPSADAALFSATRRRIPPAAALAGARGAADGRRVRLDVPLQAVPAHEAPHRLEFFALDGGRIVAAAEQKLSVSGAAADRKLHLDLAQATPVEPGFTALRGVLVADGGPGAGSSGWIARIDVPLTGPAAAVAPAAARDADSRSSATDAAAPAAALPAAPHAAADSPGVPGAASAGPGAPSAAPGTAVTSVIAFAGAFLGGLILNLMPCVFPVLSLKLIGLVKHRGETPARLRAHGLAFMAGVVLSFLVLAGLLLALRAAGSQIGWGFQLQSPLVIVALIGLFFLIGLNLLGAFEFTMGAGLANSRAAQALDGAGVRGSFATGVLAAVVASPCTAPFMGAALGYAVTQPAPVALLVFAVLGAGMATPYLVLTLVPSLLQRLPRPGAWMEHLRQFMAFPMFLTCVWLFWVLGQQTDMNAVGWMLLAMVALGLFAWAVGLAQRGAAAYRWMAGVAAACVALALFPLARTALQAPVAVSEARAAESAAAGGEANWTNWSPQAQRAAIDSGHAVFVDFTAAWCITCQANKRIVLADERVEQAFVRGDVVRMQADWTRRDETITRELARFSRSGVPMYVLYDRAGRAHLLPEILSIDEMLAALAAL